jgi:hypothetical protein
MDRIVDDARFGHCPACGDEIVLHDLTMDQIDEKARKVKQNGGQCDRCIEGSTPFEKQARFQILQFIGPTALREQVASVIEPQNASYAVVTLRDGRSARIFRRGESYRNLPEEIEHVFSKAFPDLKRMEK